MSIARVSPIDESINRILKEQYGNIIKSAAAGATVFGGLPIIEPGGMSDPLDKALMLGPTLALMLGPTFTDKDDNILKIDDADAYHGTFTWKPTMQASVVGPVNASHTHTPAGGYPVVGTPPYDVKAWLAKKEGWKDEAAKTLHLDPPSVLMPANAEPVSKPVDDERERDLSEFETVATCVCRIEQDGMRDYYTVIYSADCKYHWEMAGGAATFTGQDLALREDFRGIHPTVVIDPTRTRGDARYYDALMNDLRTNGPRSLDDFESEYFGTTPKHRPYGVGNTKRMQQVLHEGAKVFSNAVNKEVAALKDAMVKDINKQLGWGVESMKAGQGKSYGAHVLRPSVPKKGQHPIIEKARAKEKKHEVRNVRAPRTKPRRGR